MVNSEYQQLMGIANRTTHRDLSDLVEKGLFTKVGTRGKGGFLQGSAPWAKKGPIGPKNPEEMT
jgi:hypothetical protein